MQEPQPKEQPATDEPKYGVVEIFGHRQHAGRVLEVEQFGAKMLRIDVPKTDKEGVASFDNGYETHFYGGGSIFSFSPATLETVIRMNKTYPGAGMRSLPSYASDWDGDDDDDPEDDPIIHGDPQQAEGEPEKATVEPVTGKGLPDVEPAPENRTTLMRATDEILARIAAVGDRDWIGVRQSDLIECLTFDAARQFLKDDVTADQWTQNVDPEKSLREYMSFAWEKANDCRGLSAGRSLNHIQEWIWLMGDDAWSAKVDAWSDGYTLYGKPVLREVCEHYGIDWRALDNGHWTNDEGEDGDPADSIPRLAAE